MRVSPELEHLKVRNGSLWKNVAQGTLWRVGSHRSGKYNLVRLDASGRPTRKSHTHSEKTLKLFFVPV